MNVCNIDNQIGVNGAKALGDALQHNTTLTTLNVGGILSWHERENTLWMRGGGEDGNGDGDGDGDGDGWCRCCCWWIVVVGRLLMKLIWFCVYLFIM